MRLLQLDKKIMAWAGVILTTYLLFHMVTNLTFFASARFSAFYNFYNSDFIRWPIFTIVVVALLVHVRAAIRIRRHNAKARTIEYKKHDKIHVPSGLVSLSIALLFAFILLHIWQALNLDTSEIYGAVTNLFHSTITTLIYLAGLGIMALHMQHSLRNVLQTLGITSRTYHGLVLAAVGLLTLGFASVPVSIYLGLL